MSKYAETLRKINRLINQPLDYSIETFRELKSLFIELRHFLNPDADDSVPEIEDIGVAIHFGFELFQYFSKYTLIHEASEELDLYLQIVDYIIINCDCFIQE